MDRTTSAAFLMCLWKFRKSAAFSLLFFLNNYSQRQTLSNPITLERREGRMDWNQKIRERTMIPAFFFGFHVPPFPRPPQLLDFLSFGSFKINDVNCNGNDNATKKKSSNPGSIQFCLSCPLRCLTTTLQRVVLFRDSLLPYPENGPEPSSGPFSGPLGCSIALLQYCTTQRLGVILEVVNIRKDLRRRLTSLRIA